ncbi:MAG TPA: hypothetical protein VFE53_23420 [Mucilaginibacter sp.]|jgi:hypothetical protein|nr:hypothetical protein [Mucilaginibacter sp.]
MIEIFKTNVSNKRLAGRVLKALHRQLPAYTFNFDLEDCDRILRAQTKDANLMVGDIINIAKSCGLEIQLLVD